MAKVDIGSLRSEQIGGFKYLRALQEVLEPLRRVPAHGNRELLMHQYVSLLLLYFFNPVLTSLRGLQQATGLGNVQEATGIKPLSLGALSQAGAKVFDPALLEPILEHLARRCQAIAGGGVPTWDQTHRALLAADGSFFRGLPSMAWALFRRADQARGVKLHLQLDIRRSVPVTACLTEAASSEKKALAKALQSEALYLLDRGYSAGWLLAQIDQAGSQFIVRVKEHEGLRTGSERRLTPADEAAGVLIDQEACWGVDRRVRREDLVLRRLVVEGPEGQKLVLVTNALDLSAQVVADLYRWRWQIELFFRWFKSILGCTHWISRSRRGLTLQVYVALIASMLVALWSGRKPTKRTFEMLCLYFQGWARAEELATHLAGLNSMA